MGKALKLSHAEALSRIDLNLETVVRRIVRVFDKATPSDIEAGARWYDEAGDLVAELAARAGSLEHAAAVVSHLSPRTPWTRNVEGAIELIITGKAPGCLGANIERALVALKSDDPMSTLKGPKTSRFARNMLGDREAVTVDVWAARVAEVDEALLGRKGVYQAIEHAYRLAARRRGVDPATMQATTWVIVRNGRAA